MCMLLTRDDIFVSVFRFVFRPGSLQSAVGMEVLKLKLLQPFKLFPESRLGEHPVGFLQLGSPLIDEGWYEPCAMAWLQQATKN